MDLRKPWVLLVVSEEAVAQDLLGRVLACADSEASLATSLAEAHALLRLRNRRKPAAILLDESAIGAVPVSTTVCELARLAPVVLVLGQERGIEIPSLEALLSTGHADLVPRRSDFIARAVRRLERRLQAVSAVPENVPDFPSPVDFADAPEDFGEILRHEMNNPLTGILGNAELLLARRENLPAAAVRRLEIIAHLAMRLRETIRRLSGAWEAHHDHARSA